MNWPSVWQILCTVKKVNDFRIPSRDVTNSPLVGIIDLFLAREIAILFYSVLLLQADSASSGIFQDLCRGLQDGSQESQTGQGKEKVSCPSVPSTSKMYGWKEYEIGLKRILVLVCTLYSLFCYLRFILLIYNFILDIDTVTSCSFLKCFLLSKDGPYIGRANTELRRTLPVLSRTLVISKAMLRIRIRYSEVRIRIRILLSSSKNNNKKPGFLL
jgi:hypothetical protein